MDSWQERSNKRKEFRQSRDSIENPKHRKIKKKKYKVTAKAKPEYLNKEKQNGRSLSWLKWFSQERFIGNYETLEDAEKAIENTNKELDRKNWDFIVKKK